MIQRALSAAMLVLAAVPILPGQTEQGSIAFEVASIKPADPTQSIAFRRSGYRIATTSTSLEWLITWAYDIPSDRLYGKPGWLDTVRYDIVANAPQNSEPVRSQPGQPTRLQRMMQTLLADRFKLAVHSEKKELPMYALIAASGGAKIQLRDAGGEANQNPFSMPGRGNLIGTQVSTEMLAKVLSNQVGVWVQDQTGLKGVFDFKLTWEPDTEVIGAETATLPPSPIRAGSSIFTAIQEQLGLKLQARKGMVEVLVIDHIERTPTEN